MRPVRLVVVALSFLALPLLSQLPAAAHAGVLSTLPADGQELTESPSTLEVAFNETVTMPDDGVRLVGEDGTVMQLTFRLEETVSGTLVVSDPGVMEDGWYALTWRAISADGHPVDGSSRFRVWSGGAATEAPLELPEITQPSLSYSFPAAASVLRYPPRESRFVFDRAVQASGFSAFLVFDGDGSSEQLQRLSSGLSEELLLRLPVLSPGSYRIGWELESGPQGSIRFEVADSITSPGGGNHRHSTDDLYLESFSSWFPRALLLALSGLLAGLWARSRRPSATLLDAVGPRAAGAAVALTALVGVGVSVVEGLVRFHDHPLAGVLAFDAVWVYALIALIGVALAVSGRTGQVLLGSAAAVSALIWSIGPFLQFRYGAAVPLAGALSYLALSALSFAFVANLSSMTPRRTVVGLFFASAAASSALLFATAQTFDLLGNFAWEWSLRWRIILPALLLMVIWSRLKNRSSLAFKLLTAALFAASLLSVWMPPPAPGV